MASSSTSPAKVNHSYSEESRALEEKEWDIDALRYGLQSPPRRYRDVEKFRLPNAVATASGGGAQSAAASSSRRSRRRRRKKAAKPKSRKPPVWTYKRTPQASESGGSNGSSAAEVDPEVAVPTDEEEEEEDVGDDDYVAPTEVDNLDEMPILLDEEEELKFLEKLGWKQDEAPLTQEEIDHFLSMNPDKRKQKAGAADARRAGGA